MCSVLFFEEEEEDDSSSDIFFSLSSEESEMEPEEERIRYSKRLVSMQLFLITYFSLISNTVL